MAGRLVYLVGVGLMSLGAAAPMEREWGPLAFVAIACAWTVGAFIPPVHLAELLSDHYRTMLAFYGFAMAMTLFVPPLALLVLTALLFLVRNPDFFGLLALTSLIVLGFGLAEAPSYAPPAVTLAGLLAAAHARAARTFGLYSAGIVLLMLSAAFCAGGLLALSTPPARPGPKAVPSGDSAARSDSSGSAGKSEGASDWTKTLIFEMIALPALGFFLVRHLHRLTHRHRDQAAGGAAAAARLEKDEAMSAKLGTRFTGSGANAAVVKTYLKWRAQLATCGCKLAPADTAEEGAAALALFLNRPEEARVGRITAIFNRARYGAEQVTAADAEEFAALTRAIARECQKRRASMR